jgi:hypothetical protein
MGYLWRRALIDYGRKEKERLLKNEKQEELAENETYNGIDNFIKYFIKV